MGNPSSSRSGTLLDKTGTDEATCHMELTSVMTIFLFRFRTLIRPYYRGAAGMVLAYDVTDEKTFQNIEEWMQAIVENTQEFQV